MICNMRDKQLQILYAVQVANPFYLGTKIESVVMTLVLYERFENGASRYEWDYVRNYEYDNNNPNLYLPENPLYTADERLYNAVLSYAKEKIAEENYKNTDIVVGAPKIFNVSEGNIYKGEIMDEPVKFAHAILNNVSSRGILEEYVARGLNLNLIYPDTKEVFTPLGSEALFELIQEQFYQGNDFDLSFEKNVITLKNSFYPDAFKMFTDKNYAVMLDNKYLSGLIENQVVTSYTPALALRFISEDNALDFTTKIMDKVTDMNFDIYVEKRIEELTINVSVISGKTSLVEQLPYIMLDDKAS